MDGQVVYLCTFIIEGLSKLFGHVFYIPNELFNPNLENQNYLSFFPSVKKEISFAKIRTNSHKLHSETGCWSILKTPWDERVCHLCDTKKV